MIDTGTEDLLRELTPQVLGALVRRYGNFDSSEDAVSEALLAAATQWPVEGVPDDPRAWLIRVASRRLIDLLRSDQARRRREESLAQWEIQPASPVAEADDSLILLFLCCHPSLSLASQLALTLRAVGGLTTTEIARAFLVPEATMTRRITRAKQSIAASGIPFALPPGEQRLERVAAVQHVLYLIFNEGYASTTGPDLHRPELATEAIRLARLMHRLLPDDSEAAGLLALMLLTDARRPARTGPDGELISMADQDRSRWDADKITDGVSLISAVLPRREPGPYQLQAAIAAIHDEAPSAEETDWPQIVALYRLLLQTTDNPVVELNHAVAVAMADGPQSGLELITGLEQSGRLKDDHRPIAVRAHLLELDGDHEAARSAYLDAAERAINLPQQRYLRDRAARLENRS